MRKAEKNVVNQ